MNSDQQTNSNRPILIKPPKVSSEQINIHSNHSSERNPEDSFEIVLIDNGSANIFVESISYSVGYGDIFIPKNHYSIKSQDLCGVVILNFSNFLFSGLADNHVPFADNELVLSYNNTTIPIINTIKELDTELQEKKDQYKVAAEKLSEYLFILLERKLGNWNNFSTSFDIIEGIKEYVEKNYEKPLTLSSLSDTFFLSPFHISHMFKDRYGISPIQYLINTRIKVSKELLSKTDYSIVEISSLVGYPNANYYNVIFKRFEGISPGKFRKKNRKKD